ncbi:hypothetical protein Tco_1090965 [Tanacetum coccineum]|uniref:Uncharacterized protein n=1 Tax=Tanacetum coccineum TaxID=301880 RepID=A0ABQ5I5Q6_9ASTR
MKHVKSLSDDQLKTEFDKIRTAAADLQSQNIRRSLKRPSADLEQPSSKKSKSTEVPKSDVPADTQQPFVEVPSQKAPIEDVEVHSNTASTTQHTDGDPEAEHKMCLKYASDADSAFDDDTPVNLHAVVDWELLPTGLGWINAIYRKDNSRKCFTSLREILHLVTRVDLMTIYGRVMTFYQDKKAAEIGLVLWGDLKVLMDSPEIVGGLVVHMFVNKKYPLYVNLIERMLDNQLEICQDTVGNDLTIAVQLIAFLKKQIADSRRPKATRLESIESTIRCDCLVDDSKFMKVALESFQDIDYSNLGEFSTKDLSRILEDLCQIQKFTGQDCLEVCKEVYY